MCWYHYLDTHCPDDGILLGSGLWICMLGYADDSVLLSNSQAGLHRLIDRAHGWCGCGHARQCPETQVMVFKGPLPLPTPLTCAGQPLECVVLISIWGVCLLVQQEWVARLHISVGTCGQHTRRYVASMVNWGVPLHFGFSSTSFLRVLL
jgi:hypothetical protein